MEFIKIIKSLQFLMVQGYINPNITFLGEKLWLVAWNKKITSVIRKKSKNAYKKCKNENLEKK